LTLEHLRHPMPPALHAGSVILHDATTGIEQPSQYVNVHIEGLPGDAVASAAGAFLARWPIEMPPQREAGHSPSRPLGGLVNPGL
jgi:hypothetical protein